MPLREITDEPLAAPVAVVLLLDDPDDVARCLRSLLPTLPPGATLLAGGTDRGRTAAAELAGAVDVTWLGVDGAAAWNEAAKLAPAADLALVDGRTEVAEEWLETLRAVAAGDVDAATVTALSNDAAFLSAPRRNLPWPLLAPARTPAEAAARVREGALGLHPRSPTALPHCALVTRRALQLAGAFDADLPPGEALADFCVRAGAAGLAHVVADELLVAHRGEPGSDARTWPGAAGDRHPALREAVAEAADDRHSALARALLSVSVALEPLSVTVDARPLSGGVSGTTVHLVELLGGLAERDDVRVRALLPPAVGPAAGRALAAMPAVESLDAATAATEVVARTHVVHRPWQVESAQEMAFLDRLGERTVVTQQDLIGYRTPGVFGTPQEWRDYRAATRASLHLAAMVVCFTHEAARDVAAEDLVPPERLRVVKLGAGSERLGAGPEPVAPALVAGRERPFLVVLGNRFRHKNVRFALELLSALRSDHGWEGELVVAGADVLHGSGRGDDAAWALRNPEDAAAVLELGAVGDAEKAWLLREAAAVVYPSTYEGFGLVPFEAAQAGTPCALAHVSAMQELVPPELALLEPWDARASAARLASVLDAGPARDALVAGLRAAAASLTWEATAEGLLGVYRDALAQPAPSGAVLAADLADAERRYWAVRDRIPAELWELVGPGGGQVDPALARDLSAMLAQRDGRRRLLRGLQLARRLPLLGRG